MISVYPTGEYKSLTLHCAGETAFLTSQSLLHCQAERFKEKCPVRYMDTLHFIIEIWEVVLSQYLLLPSFSLGMPVIVFGHHSVHMQMESTSAVLYE